MATGCQKAYGSEGALKHHFKTKHPDQQYQRVQSQSRRYMYHGKGVSPPSYPMSHTMTVHQMQPPVTKQVDMDMQYHVHMSPHVMQTTPQTQWVFQNQVPTEINKSKRRAPGKEDESTLPRKREKTLGTPFDNSVDEDLTVSSYALPSPSYAQPHYTTYLSPNVTLTENLEPQSPTRMSTNTPKNSKTSTRTPRSNKSPDYLHEDPYKDYNHYALPWHAHFSNQKE